MLLLLCNQVQHNGTPNPSSHRIRKGGEENGVNPQKRCLLPHPFLFRKSLLLNQSSVGPFRPVLFSLGVGFQHIIKRCTFLNECPFFPLFLLLLIGCFFLHSLSYPFPSCFFILPQLPQPTSQHQLTPALNSTNYMVCRAIF